MERVAFIFKIKPEFKAEYKKAHDEIWPDMAKVIKESGIKNYSIFFRKDGTLFAYLETENYQRSMEYLSKQEANIRWQKHMDKYLVKKDKSVIGPECEMLEEVFHIN